MPQSYGEKTGNTTICSDIEYTQTADNQDIEIYRSDIFTFKRDFL